MSCIPCESLKSLDHQGLNNTSNILCITHIYKNKHLKNILHRHGYSRILTERRTKLKLKLLNGKENSRMNYTCFVLIFLINY